MRQQLARVDGDQFAYSGRDRAAAVDHDTFAADPSCVNRDGPDEVGLHLECGVALPDLERRVDSASHRRIQQRHREPSVHDADRVVQVLRRLALEDGLALFEMDAFDAHRFGDRRRRKPALESVPQRLEAALAGRGLGDEQWVRPGDRPAALRFGVHSYPEKADITAKIPSTAIARPPNVLIPRTTPGVRRARSSEAASTRMHHHAAEPSSTPATTSAGPANEPPVPKPRVAARAANEMIVAGLVTVSPRVER